MSSLSKLLIVACACWVAGSAHAHAPLPRALSVSSDGAAVALSLPGFGMMVRSDPSQPFAYACDALLGVAPSSSAPALARRGDGVVLLGTPSGLRAMQPDGCPLPLAGALLNVPVFALAVADATAYAVAGTGVWRSLDGGGRWELRMPLAGAGQVTGLLIDPSDASRVYLSTGSSLLASSDGGSSFTTFAQARELTLVRAQSADKLWAVARAQMSSGNRGFEILRAASAAGPWRTVLKVDYFGGLSIDDRGVVWVGDEAGGLHRSDDGESFHDVASDLPAACLAATDHGLWACTPGTRSTDAVLTNLDAQGATAHMVALSEADHMVSCEADVVHTCAAAWVEWQRDVLMRNLDVDAGGSGATSADTGVDGGLVLAAESSDGEHVPSFEAAPSASVPDAAGCALGQPSGSGVCWMLTLVLAGWHRRARRGHHPAV